MEKGYGELLKLDGNDSGRRKTYQNYMSQVPESEDLKKKTREGTREFISNRLE